jgi:predicted DNA-binding protein YlxM (UPF0122 family)
MLKENHRKAIEMYFEGKYTMQEIADECGYADRSSIYDILKKPEAKEYIEELSQESLKDALNTFRINSKALSKEIVKIANGEVKHPKHVYAQLQALNSVLEKAGLTTKNTVVIEKDNKNNDSDYNELMDMLKNKEQE